MPILGKPSLVNAFAVPTRALAGVCALFCANLVGMELDRIVAVVDDDIVMHSELQEQMIRVRAQVHQQGSRMPPTSVLERQVMERLVLEKIQLQVADEVGVEVEEKALDAAVQDIAERNNLSLQQFIEIVESEGHRYEHFREQIRQEITMAKLRKTEVDNRVKVRDREIENFLTNEFSEEGSTLEYRLAHILVSSPEFADNAELNMVREKAEDVVTRVDAGEDFGTLAISVSDGQTALEGGDLGWRKAEQIPTLFADAVSAMEVGDISSVITNPSGFHIIQLTDKREGEKIMVEQHRVRHILVEPNELVSPAQALARVGQLRGRLEQGADFARLARTNSDDRGSALQGGNLGWVGEGKMVPEFEEMMLFMEIGKLSKPFKSEFGFHVLQVLERREYDGTEEIKRDRARRAIRQRKIDERRQSWLRRLRDEAYVEYRTEE